MPSGHAPRPPLEALDDVREVALVRTPRAHARDRARRTRAPHGPRPSGTAASSDPAAQSASRCRWTRWNQDDRPSRCASTTHAHAAADEASTSAARTSTAGRHRQCPADDAAAASVATVTLDAVGLSRDRQPVAAAAHGFDQRVLRRTARAPGAGGGCARRPCAPRCRRDRPRPGRAAACASARARDAPGRSAAAGTRWARARPVAPSTVTRCVAGSSSARRRRAAPAPLRARAAAAPP